MNKFNMISTKLNLEHKTVEYHACVTAAKVSLIQNGMTLEEAEEKVNAWAAEVVTDIESSPQFQNILKYFTGELSYEESLGNLMGELDDIINDIKDETK